jgi:hypothetical protein
LAAYLTARKLRDIPVADRAISISRPVADQLVAHPKTALVDPVIHFK